MVYRVDRVAKHREGAGGPNFFHLVSIKKLMRFLCIEELKNITKGAAYQQLLGHMFSSSP